VEKEEEPHDLCLIVLHTFPLRALVKVGVVLSFFGMFFLGCFQFGFLIGWWASLLGKTWQSLYWVLWETGLGSFGCDSFGLGNPFYPCTLLLYCLPQHLFSS
jgi:hypothetical protein